MLVNLCVQVQVQTAAFSNHVCLQVVKVGPGRKKEDSDEMVKPNVEIGQTVMYSKFSGTEFEVRGVAACVPVCTHTLHIS